MFARDINQRIDLFASATTEHPAAEEEGGNVRSESGGQLEARGKIQTVAREALQAQQSNRGIAAAASKPASGGDCLLQFCARAAFPSAFLFPHRAGAIDQIALIGWKGGIGAFDRNVGIRAERQSEAIMQRNGLKDGPDFVIAVRSFEENLEAQVDFGKSA